MFILLIEASNVKRLIKLKTQNKKNKIGMAIYDIKVKLSALGSKYLVQYSLMYAKRSVTIEFDTH